MNYLAKYYKNLCEQLSSEMSKLVAELDAREKARAENKKLQSQSQSAFDAVRQKEFARYNIPGMPALSGNIEFSSQSRARAGSGIASPENQLDAFYGLSKEKQELIAPGISSEVLGGMQQAQYDRSQGIMAGKKSPKLTSDSVSAQNLISKTLKQRKEHPMGGMAAARTYAETAKTKALPSSFSARELQSISDEAEKEGKAQFASGQKTISPSTHAAIQNIEAAQKERREKDTKSTQELMASREQNARRMYGDQWMKYV